MPSVLLLRWLGTIVSLNLFFSAATELLQFRWTILSHLVSILKQHYTAFPGTYIQHIFLLHEILERLLVYPDFNFSFYSHIQFQRKFPFALVKDLVWTCSSFYFD